ncbi:MAG: hypothetical protein HRT37_17435 [Alteromonadaceae bacterium]|nr:hypothetical protein [Alteromonadaceae bacterium]
MKNYFKIQFLDEFKKRKTQAPFAFLTILLLMFSVNSFAGSWQQNVSIKGFSKVHIYTPDSNSDIGSGKSLLIVLHGCVQQ